MIKKALITIVFIFSISVGENIIKIKLANGSNIEGGFIGTYMNHVHLLIKDKIQYFNCNDIESITKISGAAFSYNCNENTVTADILFPPQLNPMTGEWETVLPDPFVKKKQKPIVEMTLTSRVDPSITKKTLLKTTKKTQERTTEENKTITKKTPEVLKPFSTTLSEQEIRILIKNEVQKEVKKMLPYEIKKQRKKELQNRLQAYLIGCGAWFFFLMMIG